MLVSQRLKKHIDLQKASRSSPSVKRGARGPHVAEIQDLLVDLGHKMSRSRNANGFDGVFGDETEKAIKDFQRKSNLVSDGIVGSKTLSAFDAQISKRPDLDSPVDGQEVIEAGLDVQRPGGKQFWEG